MKKSVALLLTVALLFGMFATVSAYEFPNELWDPLAKFERATKSNNAYGIIEFGKQCIEIVKKEPLNAQTFDALSAWYEHVAVAYENIGEYELASQYFSDLLWYQKQDPDILYGQIKLHASRCQQYDWDIRVYTDGGTTKHFGAKNEKISGVLYGTCSNGATRSVLPNESMVLTYQELGDRSLFDYSRRILREARESGLGVEFALNCPREGSDIASIESHAQFLYELSGVFAEFSDVAVYLRFGAEFDVWSNATTPDRFVKAFRYVSDIFHRQNNNVALVWSPTVAAGWNVDVHEFYPGDQWVDWIGVSLYANPYYANDPYAKQQDEVYFRTGKNANPVLALEDFVETYGDRKPIMISECGCGHTTGSGVDKTDYATRKLKEYLSYLPMVYPQIKIIAYFDHNVSGDSYDYRLSSNDELQNVFLKYTKMGHFAQDSFMDEADIVYREFEDNIYVNSVFPVATYAHIYDDEIKNVNYFIDDQWIAAENDVPFMAYLDLSEFEPGKHTLRVVATGEKKELNKYINFTLLENKQKDVEVYVSNERVKFDQWPVIYNDRTMVPMRKIFEALGADVKWDAETQTVTGTRGAREVKVSIGSTIMETKNGNVLLDTAPILINGRTLVPVRAIAEGLGCDVEWNEKENAVYIKPKVYAWSDWVKKLPVSVDKERYIIEEKVQYSYREKEYYESEYIKPFEECIDEKKIYGRWSDWTRNVMYGRSDLQVESRTQSSPVYYRFTHYCTGNIADKEDRYCTAPSKFNEACDFHDLGWLDYKLDPAPDGKSGYVQYRSDGELKRCSNSCYRWYIADTKGGDYTEYRSREITTIYTYERWGDWSDYNDVDPHDYIPRSDWNDIEVRTREFYRYKERA